MLDNDAGCRRTVGLSMVGTPGIYLAQSAFAIAISFMSALRQPIVEKAQPASRGPA